MSHHIVRKGHANNKGRPPVRIKDVFVPKCRHKYYVVLAGDLTYYFPDRWRRKKKDP